MGIFTYRFLLVLGFLTLISGGCADNAEEKVATALVTAASNSLPAQPTATSQATPGDLSSLPPTTKVEQTNVAFAYPFPDREDLFLPPATKPPANENRPERDEDVALMGFADVGEARVVLRIDGIVTSLRVGESRGDVGVQAIDPPKVDLLRGERQWTESLAETE